MWSKSNCIYIGQIIWLKCKCSGKTIASPHLLRADFWGKIFSELAILKLNVKKSDPTADRWFECEGEPTEIWESLNIFHLFIILDEQIWNTQSTRFWEKFEKVPGFLVEQEHRSAILLPHSKMPAPTFLFPRPGFVQSSKNF